MVHFALGRGIVISSRRNCLKDQFGRALARKGLYVFGSPFLRFGDNLLLYFFGQRHYLVMEGLVRLLVIARFPAVALLVSPGHDLIPQIHGNASFWVLDVGTVLYHSVAGLGLDLKPENYVLPQGG